MKLARLSPYVMAVVLALMSSMAAPALTQTPKGLAAVGPALKAHFIGEHRVRATRAKSGRSFK